MQSDGDILSDALSEEQEAIQLMRSGKLELARYRLAKLCKKYPQHAKFHFNYALVLYKLKNFEEALDEVNTGLWLKPDDVKATQFKQELLARMAKSKPARTSPPSRPESTVASSPPGLTKAETVEVQENESQPALDDQLAASSRPALIEEEQVNMTPVIESTTTSTPESMDHQEKLPEAPEPEIASEVHPEETEIEEKEKTQGIEPPSELIQEDLASEIAVKETEETPSIEHSSEPIPETLASGAIVKEIELPQEFSTSFIENLKASLSSGSENQGEVVKPETGIQEDGKQEEIPARDVLADQDVSAMRSVEMSNETETPPPSTENVPLPTQEPLDTGTEVDDTSDVKIIDETSTPKPTPDEVIIYENYGSDMDQEPVEVIEVEPRVTIIEKAADVSVEHGELQSSSSPSTSSEEEQEGIKVEEVQGPVIVDASSTMEDKEMEQQDAELKVPANRLINLRDLFKESKEKIMEACDAATSEAEQPSILHDTVDLEPFDESRLITFKSLNELNVYKCSIQALVLKYLEKKAERESQEEPGISTAATLEPAPASIPDVGTPGILEPKNEFTESLTQDNFLPTDLVNTELDQEILGTLIDALDATSEYPQYIDYKTRIEQDMLEKINTSGNGTPLTADGVIAQLVDMKTYAEDVRLNRNLIKNKGTLVNDMLGNEAAPVLAEIESTIPPTQVYSPEKAMQSDTLDVEQQIDRLEQGDQVTFTESMIQNILGMIRQIGERAANETETEVDFQVKETLAKIKRAAHRLYENAQYEQSLTIYSLMLNYFPEDFEVLFNTGFCYREMGNYAEGEKIFKRIIELFYDNAYAWYNLSLIYAFTNEGDKESYCLQKAREFGYVIDINRLSRLNLAYTQKNPFDFD